LTKEEIFEAVDRFYRTYYLRPEADSAHHQDDAGRQGRARASLPRGLRIFQEPAAAEGRSGRRWGMSAFPVSPEKEAQLTRRMIALGVREADLEETFVRSGGHGGQNVNKTSTCVMLLHRPTGLQVKCQATRQQGLNRFIARRLLLDKIEERQKGYVDAERARIEKIRRQKRKRSRRALARMLASKSLHADKKEFRRRVQPE
jgi:peptide chain release factor